jgi:hypothetical protein
VHAGNWRTGSSPQLLQLLHLLPLGMQCMGCHQAAHHDKRHHHQIGYGSATGSGLGSSRMVTLEAVALIQAARSAITIAMGSDINRPP